MDNAIQPTLEEIGIFLRGYGWTFKVTTAEGGKEVIVTNYALADGRQGVLLTFSVEGEFVMVSTLGLLKDVPKEEAVKLLSLNDSIKLVKLFMVNRMEEERMEVELGFELWAGSWKEQTFWAFMDMLCLGIDKVLEWVEEKKLTHRSEFLSYTKKAN